LVFFNILIDFYKITAHHHIMQDHTPNIEDPKFPNNSSNTSSIVIGVIVLLCMIFGSVFLFYILPADEEEHFAYPSSAAYTASSSVSVSPTHSAGINGTYLKLSVTPDDAGDDLEQQAQTCAKILRKKFLSLPYPVGVTTGNGFIEVIVMSPDPDHTRQVKGFLVIKGKLSIHLVHRQTATLAAQVASEQKAVPGYIALSHKKTNSSTGVTSIEQVLIRSKKEVSDKEVKVAYLDPRDPTIINIELTEAGGKKMEAFTLPLTASVDMIATVFDGKVINYATLNADSLGRRFVITGLDSKQEAEHLCHSLQSPLTSTLKIIEQRPYSP
jgi:preprotein translocase subunit SecD